MGITAARTAAVVPATWTTLILLLLAPSPLPEHWRYYICSPASVGLWLLAMLVSPLPWSAP